MKWFSAVGGAFLCALGIVALWQNEWAAGIGLALLGTYPLVRLFWKPRHDSTSANPARQLVISAVVALAASVAFMVLGLGDSSPARGLAFLAAFFGFCLASFLLYLAKRASGQGH